MMWGNRRLLCACGAIVSVAQPALAANTELTPLADLRLRYETVDQVGFAKDSHALTLRARPGFQIMSGHWSAIFEGEGTAAPINDNNDGTNGKTAFPLIVDPRNIELNRAQIRYEAAPGSGATLGRQRIEIADQRFVGSSSFRQNEQTFDAVRLQAVPAKDLTVDLTYSWSVRTVNGRHGTGPRQQAVGGDNIFALVGYATPIGTLGGFAFLVDQDEGEVQGFRLSSQTYGLRLTGSAPLSKSASVAYSASWARQSDYHRNPNDYAAEYRFAEAVLNAKALTATLGYELLGADDGVALTSVQTPLASLFKFQGWADKFTTTPPNGLRDLYGSIGYGWNKVGPTDRIVLSAVYHRFDSDRLSQHYGNELDLLASVKRGRYLLSARYARYRADLFATHTDKFWLSLDWTL